MQRRVTAILAGAALVTLAGWPVTTHTGYDHRVITTRLTLIEKTLAFVDRDLAMRRLTKEIAGADGTREERLMRMYEWVVVNIHDVPVGLPVIDDHIWNVFVRRYGAIDQRAEALALLASYDGMPASTVPLGKVSSREVVQLTIVNVGGRLVVLDVNNRIIFHNLREKLATVAELQGDPSLVRANAAGLTVDGVPYEEHFARFQSFTPNFARMQKQHLIPRLRAELSERVAGF
jgi:hypothetical protein